MTNYYGPLHELSIDHIFEGVKVAVEYLPVPFAAKKKMEKSEAFAGGCTLKLISISVLDTPEDVDISSPSKRRKLN